MNISWNDVQMFIAWINQRTGQDFRLPSSVEWEYAARASSKSLYPWGDDLGQNNLNCADCGGEFGGKQTSPIGFYKPNKFGLYDMLGNVSEWTSNCFPTRAQDGKTCMKYIYRGAAWNWAGESVDPRYALMSTNIDIRQNHVGFRLAQ